MEARSLQYGPRFQALTGLWRRDGEALATVIWPAGERGWHLHPGALDSALQVALAAMPDGETTLLPIGFERLIRRGDISSAAFVHATLAGAVARVAVLDAEGEVLVAIEGIRVRALEAPPEGLCYRLGWECLEPATQEARSWRLIPDQGGVAEALAAALRAQGDAIEVLDGDRLDLESASGTVVDLRGLDATSPEDAAALLPLAQALDARPAPLTVLTAGAAFVPEEPRPVSVAAAAFVGLARVIAAELPATAARRIDLDPDSLLDLDALVAALRADDGEDEVALRGGARYGRRLLPLPPISGRAPAGRRSFAWEEGRGWVASPTPQPGTGSLLIRVNAATPSGDSACGVVVARGEAGPPVGARVVALGAGLRAREAVVDAHLCWPAPPDLDDLAAAVLPARWRGVAAAALPIPGPETPILGQEIDAHATWLLTGGLGGLGRVIATELARRGVSALVLAGRAGQRPDWADALAPTVVRVVSLDVSDGAAVRALVAEIDADPALPPLRGVVHAAGVIDDAVLASLDRARLLGPFGAKIAGALHLHAATAHLDLDHFVLFSSVAGVLGSAAQAGYAAANAAVDALAWERARLGLPATAIAWGAWAEVGLAAEAGRAERLRAVGQGALSPAEGAALFSALLRSSEPWVAALRMDVAAWRAASGQRTPLFDRLVQPETEAADRWDPSRLRGLSGVALQEAFVSVIAQSASAVLHQPLERIRPDLPLRSLGLDSLMAVQLKGRLELATGLAIPVVALLKGPSPCELAVDLDGRWTAALAEAAARGALADRVDDMDEAEIDALLARMLAEEQRSA